MTSEYFKIEAGFVYDPANGIDGQANDLWIQGGKIVEPPPSPAGRYLAKRYRPSVIELLRTPHQRDLVRRR